MFDAGWHEGVKRTIPSQILSAFTLCRVACVVTMQKTTIKFYTIAIQSPSIMSPVKSFFFFFILDSLPNSGFRKVLSAKKCPLDEYIFIV